MQNLLYATVVVVGAPLVINGDITTGAMVAASMLSTRMVAPMTALCGVLARWQQVKTAKASLDTLMALPVEGGRTNLGSSRRAARQLRVPPGGIPLWPLTTPPSRCGLTNCR